MGLDMVLLSGTRCGLPLREFASCGTTEVTPAHSARVLHVDRIFTFELDFTRGDAGGRYWVRTSDLFRVREARYRCANRPRWRRDLNPRSRICSPLPRLSATPPLEEQGSPTGTGRDSLRADDGIRTRDPHLGKVMLYQLSHVRMITTNPAEMRSETIAEARSGIQPASVRETSLPPSGLHWWRKGRHRRGAYS